MLVKYRPVLLLITLIWVVEVVNIALGHSLGAWGILPRHLGGLIGIPLTPFIHGGIWHAVSNTIPLLILGFLVLGWLAGDGDLFLLYEEASGWPQVCFRYYAALSRSARGTFGCFELGKPRRHVMPSGYTFSFSDGGERSLPLVPIWSAFVVNTLFYTVVLWLLISCPSASRSCP